MIVKNPNRITTSTIATMISNRLDIPYYEVKEILILSNDLIRELMGSKNVSIQFDNLITLTPIITREHNKSYKMVISKRALKELRIKKIFNLKI